MIKLTKICQKSRQLKIQIEKGQKEVSSKWKDIGENGLSQGFIQTTGNYQ